MNPTDMRILQFVLATIWLITAALSFGLYPVEDSLLLLQDMRLSHGWALFVLYAGASADLAMGILTLALPGRRLWLCQIMLVAAYTALATLLVPEYWLHPFGPLLKNSAVLALLWLLYKYDRRAPI